MAKPSDECPASGCYRRMQQTAARPLTTRKSRMKMPVVVKHAWLICLALCRLYARHKTKPAEDISFPGMLG